MNSGDQKRSPEEEAPGLAPVNEGPGALPRTSEQLSGEKRRRGRPRGVSKTQVGIGLDHDVAAYYRGLGKGHQALMNYILRKAMEDAQHRQSTLTATRK